MYCKTITKEIFDSYIANDSDTILEGVVTNAFEGTAFRRFVRVPLAKGEHYVEALYEQDFGSFPLAMGANHFSIKNGLEFMAFIVDRKETYCKSAAFALLFDDYRKADSNWVTAEMREKFLAYIEKNYTPSAEVMKDKKFQSLTYDSAVKQYVYDRNNDTTALDLMLKLLEKFDDSVIVDYLANPSGWEERFAKALERSGIGKSFAKEFAEPFVAYLVQTRQYLDAFSADPSCWESICKNLMAAVKDRKTVRLNIEAGGNLCKSCILLSVLSPTIRLGLKVLTPSRFPRLVIRKKWNIFWKKIANGTVVDTGTVLPSRLSFPYRAGARFFGKTRCLGNNRNTVANLCERRRIITVR